MGSKPHKMTESLMTHNIIWRERNNGRDQMSVVVDQAVKI